MRLFHSATIFAATYVHVFVVWSFTRLITRLERVFFTSILVGGTQLQCIYYLCRILISRPPRVFRRFKCRSCYHYHCVTWISEALIGNLMIWQFSPSHFNLGFLFWVFPKLCYEMTTVIYIIYRDIQHMKNITIMLSVVELPYVRSDIAYIERDGISYCDECMKTVFIEIPKHIFKIDDNIIVGTVYRPAGTNIDKFYNRMEDVIISILFIAKFRDILISEHDRYVPKQPMCFKYS